MRGGLLVNIKIQKLHPNAKLPTYATDGSGCFDLYAATVNGADNAIAVFDYDGCVTCDTGLAFDIPPGHVMLVFSRSGHGFNNSVRLANCVGVIDSDYRGRVKVMLQQDAVRQEQLTVKPGDRIAQALVVPYPRIAFEFADKLSSTARGAGGFGSTGQ